MLTAAEVAQGPGPPLVEETTTTARCLGNGSGEDDYEAKSMDAELIKAATLGQTSYVKHLLSQSASARFDDCAAFRFAAGAGHKEVCRELLLAGAQPSAKNCEALRVATLNGHVELVRWLLSQPSVDGSVDGGVCLFMAARLGDVALCQLFLHTGLNRESDGPMSWAAAQGHADVVALLLKHMAPTQNSLQWSISSGQTKVAALLLLDGRVKAEALDLVPACAAGHLECLRLARAHGAPLDNDAALEATLRRCPSHCLVGWLIKTQGARPTLRHIRRALDGMYINVIDILLDHAEASDVRKAAPDLLGRVLRRETHPRFRVMLELLSQRRVIQQVQCLPQRVHSALNDRCERASRVYAQTLAILQSMSNKCCLAVVVLGLAFGRELIITFDTRQEQFNRAQYLLQQHASSVRE